MIITLFAVACNDQRTFYKTVEYTVNNKMQIKNMSIDIAIKFNRVAIGAVR